MCVEYHKCINKTKLEKLKFQLFGEESVNSVFLVSHNDLWWS